MNKEQMNNPRDLCKVDNCVSNTAEDVYYHSASYISHCVLGPTNIRSVME